MFVALDHTHAQLVVNLPFLFLWIGLDPQKKTFGRVSHSSWKVLEFTWHATGNFYQTWNLTTSYFSSCSFIWNYYSYIMVQA